MSIESVGFDLVRLKDVSVRLVRKGAGPPLLFLHGAGGARTGSSFIDQLALSASVYAPTHPGFGGSELPDWIDHIDDLVYLYMDLLDRLDLKDVTLVGTSMGGWIAAEMAVRSTRRLSRLVLVGPVGIKVGDRETRDIPDIWAMHPGDVAKAVWHKSGMAPNLAAMSDAELEQVARDQETAALYLWEPYMHNPRLKRRLHRIDIPALLLRGEHDGLISPSYLEAYAAAIPGAKRAAIPAAGHAPDVEQPKLLAEAIVEFAGFNRPR